MGDRRGAINCTRAGDWLVTGPGWKGTVPQGMTRIASPVSQIMLVGRVFVANEADLPKAYEMGKGIRVENSSERIHYRFSESEPASKWLGGLESDQDSRLQRPLSYH